MRLSFFIEIQQHDYIQKQNHDGPCIDYYVNGCQELGIHQNVMTCNAEESQDQIQYTMYRIFRKHNQDSKKHREEGEEVECV